MEVKGNASQISQVLVNIIDNAIHALQNIQIDRTITIRTQDLVTDVVVSIADNGIGIPPKYYNKILEPFFTTKTIGQGIGLGLFITFGIIQRHGGKLTFRSKEGEGTEFDITLPK